jgi:hypothetical protein
MHEIQMIRAGLGKISDQIAAHREPPKFSCCDCERFDQCGLPPSANCVVMLAQIARHGGKLNKPATSVPWRASLGC